MIIEFAAKDGVQVFGLWNGPDHEAILINDNYVPASANQNKTFPVRCLYVGKILYTIH